MNLDEMPTEGPIPLWQYDEKLGTGYLCVNPTEEVAKTEDLPVDLGYGRRLIADYDRYGRILGIEVLG